MSHYESIVRALPMEERLCQLAEECAELAKAALKLRRALTRANSTPAGAEVCMAALYEEIADVHTCIDVILMDVDTRHAVDVIEATMAAKAERWAGRLSGQGCGVDACRLG